MKLLIFYSPFLSKSEDLEKARKAITEQIKTGVVAIDRTFSKIVICEVNGESCFRVEAVDLGLTDKQMN